MSGLFHRSKKSKEKDGSQKENRDITPKSQRTVSNQQSPAQDSLAQSTPNTTPKEKTPNFPWSKHEILGDNPFPRYGQASNNTTIRDSTEIYLFGGLVNNWPQNDVHLFDISNMSCKRLTTTGEAPSARLGHSAFLVGNAFIIFGGDTKASPYDALDDTLYLMNTHTRQWAKAITHGPRPQGRYGHSLNILGANLYIFGGQVDGYFFNDLVAFDLNTLASPKPRWELLEPDGRIPPPRTNHACISYQDRLYLFGGTNGTAWFNDTWAYDPRANTWKELDCIGYIPSPREGHAATVVGDVAYFFGGRSPDGKDLGDLAAFKFSTRRWFTFQNMGPSPLGRSGHTLSACGTRVVVLGGEGGSRPTEDTTIAFVLDTGKIRYPADDEPPGFSPKTQRTPVLPQTADRSPTTPKIPTPHSPSPRSTPPPPHQQPHINDLQGFAVDPRHAKAPMSPYTGSNRQVSQDACGQPYAAEGAQQSPVVDDMRHEKRGPPRANVSPTSALAVESYARPANSTIDTVAEISDRAGKSYPKTPVDSRTSTPSPRAEHEAVEVAPLSPNRKVGPEETRVAEMGQGEPAQAEQLPAYRQHLANLQRTIKWYATELDIAKKKGYVPHGRKDISAESVPVKEHDLWETIVALRNELTNARKQQKDQGSEINTRLLRLEQERDAAIAEAAYAKAKLLGTVTEHTENARFEEISKRLASAVASEEDLARRLKLEQDAIASEKEAHKATLQQTLGYDEKLQALEESLERHMAEVTSLRKNITAAQNIARQEQAAKLDALTQLSRLQQEHADLMQQVDSHSSMSKHFSAIDGAQVAIIAATERADLLQRQLNESQQAREELRAELGSLRSDLQNRNEMVHQSSEKLAALEEQLSHTAKEADASKKIMLEGMSALVLTSKQDPTLNKSEGELKLREQLESSRQLHLSSVDAVKQAESRLAEALDQGTMYEQRHMQVSRELTNMQKKMTDLLVELGSHKRSNQELQSLISAKQRDLDTANLKHRALQEIISEKSGAAHEKSNLRNPMSPIGSPNSNDSSRLRELEARLEESEQAQRQSTAAAKAQVAETEKQFRDRLEQLETDYSSAVQYVKGTEKMLRKMKEEIAKYKTQNAKLNAQLDEARTQVKEVDQVHSDTPQETEKLRRELSQLDVKIKQDSVAFESQVRDMQTQLDILKDENGELKVSLTEVRKQLENSRASAAETKAQSTRLTAENANLAKRAEEAEEKISLLLDQMENSVDAYRQSTRVDGNILSSPAREKLSHENNRTSGALDSLANELDQLRAHWESSKSYRLSNTFDFEKRPQSNGNDLSASLAKWREGLGDIDQDTRNHL